jgi:hypothetical protein
MPTPIWTPPKTWSVREVLTAADLNKYVRDNFLAMPNWTTLGPLNPGAQSGTAESFVGTGMYFTPRRTGNVLVLASFSGGCVTTNTNWTASLYRSNIPGDTAPPRNGSIGGSTRVTGPVQGDPWSAQGQASVCMQGVAAGLTIGSRYWFDLGVSGGSIPTLSNIYMTCVEL